MENRDIEYKENWKDDYLKWICGFANAQGGKIYIGMRDDGTAIGVQNSKKLLEDIPNKIQNKLGIMADVNLLTLNGLDYIEIIVNPQAFPVNYDGEYHYRSGSTKQLLRGNALTAFLMTKTGIKWETAPVFNISIDDLDKESFDIFKREALRSGRMSKADFDASREELLDKLGLLTDGRLTRAGALCFYREPEKVIDGCYVKIGMFEGSEILYQDVIRGSLILIADRVVDFIFLKYLKAKISYRKETRVETYPFARDAVREAVYNSLIHTDWSANVPVQIRVEKETMRVGNCCVLPLGWDTAKLMGQHNSVPFNPKIAGVFFRAGYIESWGRGIQKICDACKIIGAEKPEYIVSGSDIMVVFKALQSAIVEDSKVPKGQGEPLVEPLEEPLGGSLDGSLGGSLDGSLDDTMEKPMDEPLEEPLDEPLNEPLEEQIFQIMRNIPNCTYEALTESLGVSRSTIKRAIKLLTEQGRIKRIGGKRYGYWEVAETQKKKPNGN